MKWFRRWRDKQRFKKFERAIFQGPIGEDYKAWKARMIAKGFWVTDNE